MSSGIKLNNNPSEHSAKSLWVWGSAADDIDRNHAGVS